MLQATDGSYDTFRFRLWWDDAGGVGPDVYDNAWGGHLPEQHHRRHPPLTPACRARGARPHAAGLLGGNTLVLQFADVDLGLGALTPDDR